MREVRTESTDGGQDPLSYLLHGGHDNTIPLLQDLGAGLQRDDVLVLEVVKKHRLLTLRGNTH